MLGCQCLGYQHHVPSLQLAPSAYPGTTALTLGPDPFSSLRLKFDQSLVMLQAFGQQGGAPAAKKKADEAAKMPLKAKIKALLTCLRPAYWQALIVVSLLYFARFDASFITLRAKTVRSAAGSWIS